MTNTHIFNVIDNGSSTADRYMVQSDHTDVRKIIEETVEEAIKIGLHQLEQIFMIPTEYLHDPEDKEYIVDRIYDYMLNDSVTIHSYMCEGELTANQVPLHWEQ